MKWFDIRSPSKRIQKKLRQQKALQLLDWAEQTEIRVRSSEPSPVNKKRSLLVRMSIDELYDLYRYSGVGTVGENFTLGTISTPVEIYFAPKGNWGAFDE